MDFPLDQLHPRQTAEIQSIQAEKEFSRRLSALGLRTGQLIRVLRSAPLQGPLHIRVGHTDIMIRRQDAHRIQVRLAPQV